jgi:hypothetical protein
MAGIIDCKALYLDEDITAPATLSGNYSIYSDVNDGRIKIKFSNGAIAVLSEGGAVVNF